MRLISWCLMAFVARSLALPLAADTHYYASGLIDRLDNAPRESLPLQQATSRFFATYFPNLGDFEWRLVDEVREGTHIHRLYGLYYRGRRVVDEYLKLHYHRDGWVEHATSSWRARFNLAFPPTDARVNEGILRRRLALTPSAPLRTEPVVWLDPVTGAPKAALEVRSSGRRAIVEETTGRVLFERPNARFVEHQVQIYKVYPNIPSPSVAPLAAGTLIDLDDLTKLKSPYVHVQRAKGDKSGFVDVDPDGADYTQAPFTGDPKTYNAACSDANPTGCNNQAFDATNVYYHIAKYRRRLIDYFSELGVTSCAGQNCFPSDPLPVVVNLPELDIGTDKIDSNNAAYLEDCSSLGFTRCLIFLPPAAIDGEVCGLPKGTSVELFDLAREANVVIHEFQHYVTDSITRMARSGSSFNVGDALHEGYSDALAIAYVVDESGDTTATRVLAYGFQNCSTFVRDVAVLRPYKDDASDQDPHTSGLTWASGLWNLRTRLGARAGDLLIIKSLFFQSPKPSFVGAVEALVKADEALNGGANVNYIRTLFYTELSFLGSKAGVFSDPSNLLVEVGFRSCAAVHGSPSPRWGWLTVLTWLAVTLGAGRAFSKRRS